jgi:hypothetical protein
MRVRVAEQGQAFRMHGCEAAAGGYFHSEHTLMPLRSPNLNLTLQVSRAPSLLSGAPAPFAGCAAELSS